MAQTFSHTPRLTCPSRNGDGWYSRTPATKRWRKRRLARKERFRLNKVAIAEGLQEVLEAQVDQEVMLAQEYADGCDWDHYDNYLHPEPEPDFDEWPDYDWGWYNEPFDILLED